MATRKEYECFKIYEKLDKIEKLTEYQEPWTLGTTQPEKEFFLNLKFLKQARIAFFHEIITLIY